MGELGEVVQRARYGALQIVAGEVQHLEHGQFRQPGGSAAGPPGGDGALQIVAEEVQILEVGQFRQPGGSGAGPPGGDGALQIVAVEVQPPEVGQFRQPGGFAAGPPGGDGAGQLVGLEVQHLEHGQFRQPGGSAAGPPGGDGAGQLVRAQLQALELGEVAQPRRDRAGELVALEVQLLELFEGAEVGDGAGELVLLEGQPLEVVELAQLRRDGAGEPPPVKTEVLDPVPTGGSGGKAHPVPLREVLVRRPVEGGRARAGALQRGLDGQQEVAVGHQPVVRLLVDDGAALLARGRLVRAVHLVARLVFQRLVLQARVVGGGADLDGPAVELQRVLLDADAVGVAVGADHGVGEGQRLRACPLLVYGVPRVRPYPDGHPRRAGDRDDLGEFEGHGDDLARAVGVADDGGHVAVPAGADDRGGGDLGQVPHGADDQVRDLPGPLAVAVVGADQQVLAEVVVAGGVGGRGRAVDGGAAPNLLGVASSPAPVQEPDLVGGHLVYYAVEELVGVGQLCGHLRCRFRNVRRGQGDGTRLVQVDHADGDLEEGRARRLHRVIIALVDGDDLEGERVLRTGSFVVGCRVRRQADRARVFARGDHAEARGVGALEGVGEGAVRDVFGGLCEQHVCRFVLLVLKQEVLYEAEGRTTTFGGETRRQVLRLHLVVGDRTHRLRIGHADAVGVGDRDAQVIAVVVCDGRVGGRGRAADVGPRALVR